MTNKNEDNQSRSDQPQLRAGESDPRGDQSAGIDALTVMYALPDVWLELADKTVICEFPSRWPGDEGRDFEDRKLLARQVKAELMFKPPSRGDAEPPQMTYCGVSVDLGSVGFACVLPKGHTGAHAGSGHQLGSHGNPSVSEASGSGTERSARKEPSIASRIIEKGSRARVIPELDGEYGCDGTRQPSVVFSSPEEPQG